MAFRSGMSCQPQEISSFLWIVTDFLLVFVMLEHGQRHSQAQDALPFPIRLQGNPAILSSLSLRTRGAGCVPFINGSERRHLSHICQRCSLLDPRGTISLFDSALVFCHITVDIFGLVSRMPSRPNRQVNSCSCSWPHSESRDGYLFQLHCSAQTS